MWKWIKIVDDVIIIDFGLLIWPWKFMCIKSRTLEPEEEVKWLSSLQWFIWNSQNQLFTNLNEIITASSSFTVLIVQWDKLIRLKKDWPCWLSEWIWLYTHTLKGFYGEKNNS